MPMMSNPLKDLKKPTMNRGDLIAYVIDNDDRNSKDKKQQHRVRIRIPQLHRNIPDDKLPWSIPDNTQSYGNAGKGVGSVNIPPIGAKVYVRFEENDPHNPRYSGSPTTDDVSKDHELLKEDYPHTRGSVDAAGNRQAVNNQKQTMDITHSSGTTIHIDANGTISMSGAAHLNVGVAGDINMAAKGDINFNAGKKINLNSKKKSPTAVTRRSRPSIAKPSGNTGY